MGEAGVEVVTLWMLSTDNLSRSPEELAELVGIITDAVGAKNIFDDTTNEWPQVSWETVLDRNPTALVLADLSRRSLAGDALDSKISFLESNPVTARLDAVRNKRYIVVNGADLNPSIRTVDGIEKVADALERWGYG